MIRPVLSGGDHRDFVWTNIHFLEIIVRNASGIAQRHFSVWRFGLYVYKKNHLPDLYLWYTIGGIKNKLPLIFDFEPSAGLQPSAGLAKKECGISGAQPYVISEREIKAAR